MNLYMMFSKGCYLIQSVLQLYERIIAFVVWKFFSYITHCAVVVVDKINRYGSQNSICLLDIFIFSECI